MKEETLKLDPRVLLALAGVACKDYALRTLCCVHVTVARGVVRYEATDRLLALRVEREYADCNTEADLLLDVSVLKHCGLRKTDNGIHLVLGGDVNTAWIEGKDGQTRKDLLAESLLVNGEFPDIDNLIEGRELEDIPRAVKFNPALMAQLCKALADIGVKGVDMQPYRHYKQEGWSPIELTGGNVWAACMPMRC